MLSPDPIYSIFVSSTTEDLAKYRSRARDVLLTQGLRPLVMEYFPAESGATTDVLDRHLDAADGVVIIAGARYGSLVGRQSYVEWEFEQALARGIPVVCLVVSERARRRVRSIAASERDNQERFIRRLQQHSKIAEFDDRSFERELAGALRLFPRQFRKGAGLIRVADYERFSDMATFEIERLKARQALIRLISATSLINEHSRSIWGGDKSLMNSEDERIAIERILDLIYNDILDRPITIQIMDSLLRQLVGRLHGFSEPSGFVPESLGELESSIDELFGDSLSTLKATSIHSNHEALATYKGYWEDTELGPFFKRKNEEFLARASDRKIFRVYACDSIAESVVENWFRSTVIAQVTQGASVKVVQIENDHIFQYEDFGIYEHRSQDKDAGTYLLLAPRERNQQRHNLNTSVITDSATVEEYLRKFRSLWGQSADPLRLVKSGRLDKADLQPLEVHGEGRIRDYFGQHVILRKMERIDTKEKLLPASAGFVRKYQYSYAEAISDHLKRRYAHVRNLLYVGDTYKNDGTAIRNLQGLGWDVTGFICEPKLEIERLWFNSVLYTSRWTDLIAFADEVQSKVGPHTLVLFDIDQTLWAPKGVHEGPLTRSRTRAMSRLVDEYVSPGSEVGERAKGRIELLYSEISEVKYLPLTLDNEDFKATICVFLSLNLLFDQEHLEGSDREMGAAFFEDLGRMDPSGFLDFVSKKYLRKYFLSPGGGEAKITRFIINTLSTAETYQFSRYGETNGILVSKVVEHLREIFRETVGSAPIQYAAFRTKELEETLNRVGVNDDSDFEDRLVLSKPAWDIAAWLQGRGADLLALSDRPDESTVSPSGESLLDASLTIYGRSISEFLP
jgi:hypothetical protein